MPRKPGPLNERDSTVLTVRVPNDLMTGALAQCGGRARLSEWLRNILRVACQVPLDRQAGYEEGYKAGWTEANKRFREAINNTRAA
jgi:hypothetical protein